ncbi:MAG: HAMP domain-containing histidine kinase, partial [Arcobacteraceae bacterium]|nr:HAMP domain-containing histidine kinase [Arcobacteraceae bacterium]
AHQWRQPLSAISTMASGIKVEEELNVLDTKQLSEKMDLILTKTEYLSETIDTFRDFIKEEKETKEVILQERIDAALDIVGMVLKDNQIKLNKNLDYSSPIKITMIVGELTQVIINIINNAKDVISEKKIIKPYIDLNLIKQNKKAIITIEDNAGGIPEEIIDKIFDPYFTTKHESQGTGLGLHMSRKIIFESLKGKLYVENTDIGAKFFIELPLN